MMRVEALVPEESLTATVIDLEKRGGKIVEVEPRGELMAVVAEVPSAALWGSGYQSVGSVRVTRWETVQPGGQDEQGGTAGVPARPKPQPPAFSAATEAVPEVEA